MLENWVEIAAGFGGGVLLSWVLGLLKGGAAAPKPAETAPKQAAPASVQVEAASARPNTQLADGVAAARDDATVLRRRLAAVEAALRTARKA